MMRRQLFRVRQRRRTTLRMMMMMMVLFSACGNTIPVLGSSRHWSTPLFFLFLSFPSSVSSFTICPLPDKQAIHRRTRTGSSFLRVHPKNRNTYEEDQFSRKNKKNQFHSALAIVPPLPFWDRIQRARHFARDRLYHQWPPSIRLFHPFSNNAALDVAQVVEELELEPFEITLDTWVIIPHLEAMEAAFKSAQASPETYLDTGSEMEAQQWEEDEAIRKLIEKEERLGSEKAKARAEHKIRKERNQDSAMTSSEGERDDSPRAAWEGQQQSFEDFGGPCLLCLEPDLESKQLLQDLREELAILLDYSTDENEDYFSPSSCYSWGYIEEPIFQPAEYRPLMPVGSFDSLPAALEVARRLKGLWGEPLRFLVKELHITSCKEEEDGKDEQITPSEESIYLGTGTVEEWSDLPWGCNAKIVLVGEELQPEEDMSELMKKLCLEGEAGGNDISNDYTILDDEEELSEIEMYLNDDDEYEEGMQVVIGRVHFLTGDQRTYIGMPATSVVDSKDRNMGDNVGSVSAVARRRRVSSRSLSTQWEDGEYGRRQLDYLPWSKREKPKRVKRLLDLPPGEFSNPSMYAESDGEGDDDSHGDEE